MKKRKDKTMKKTEKFNYVIKMLPPFKAVLSSVPDVIKEKALEIRIRAGRPLIIETHDERYICNNSKAETGDIYECIKYFCDYSLYSYEKELAEGVFTLKGGHRAGFTGTALVKDGEIRTIKDISSLNIRISDEHTGCSERLFSLTAFEQDLKGLLIIGPPLSAKTTMLRDYCRLLSAFRKTALIDDRGELAASYKGVPQNDIGLNCDVLTGFPKKEALLHAVKTLSPEYLFCDEVTGQYDELSDCSALGIKLVLTMHCGNISEIRQNNGVNSLLSSGAVNYICSLEKGRKIGKINGLWRIKNGEAADSLSDCNNLYFGRNNSFITV